MLVNKFNYIFFLYNINMSFIILLLLILILSIILMNCDFNSSYKNEKYKGGLEKKICMFDYDQTIGNIPTKSNILPKKPLVLF